MSDDKLSPVNCVHLIIVDLLLPREARAGLRISAMEKILARGKRQTLPAIPVETLLGDLFGLSGGTASVCAAFDGLPKGIWMRADPVHVRLERDRVVLLPEVNVSNEESSEFCASLNAHFAGEGMEFFAPHANRWYVRLEALPGIETVPLSQAAFCDMRENLPEGGDERRWRQIFNEIQMLLFAHPVNEMRESSGELPINSVWFWGNGEIARVSSPFDHVSGDDELSEMFASFSGTPFSRWGKQWRGSSENELLVYTGLRRALQRGDLSAWQKALQDFENDYARPLLQALRQGRISRLNLDILGAGHLHRLTLERMDAWAFWRNSRLLEEGP